MRYCDDFFLFARGEEEIKRAGKVAKSVIENLGLEIAINKTKYVDFDKDDFDFVGFSFKHWRKAKKREGAYFLVEPTKDSLKDFKYKIKKATRKTLTLSQEAWVKKLNPIIRGKVNYYAIPYEAIEKTKVLV